MYVVHPWEAGNDHSRRWDAFGAPGTTAADWDRAARTAWNTARMADVTFHLDGAAAWSTAFVAAPAAFNAYVAFNLSELAAVLGDRSLADRADQRGAAWPHLSYLLWLALRRWAARPGGRPGAADPGGRAGQRLGGVLGPGDRCRPRRRTAVLDRHRPGDEPALSQAAVRGIARRQRWAQSSVRR